MYSQAVLHQTSTGVVKSWQHKLELVWPEYLSHLPAIDERLLELRFDATIIDT
jgi:hypothetical protein